MTDLKEIKDIEKLSLEEAMAYLEQTVNLLEGDDITLDGSIEIFERGVKLAAHSRKLLDEYNKRITVLKKENGALVEAPMDEE